MIVPSSMVIQSAANMLGDVPDNTRQKQQSELSSFGDFRAQALGATGVSSDFKIGYELGLQTMRVLIMESRDPSTL